MVWLGTKLKTRYTDLLSLVSSGSCGLLLPDECDDEDDPEYNFLADIDEPDLEDYRDDKAVRITSQSHTLFLSLAEILRSFFDR